MSPKISVSGGHRRFANIALRAIAMLSRFGLLFGLAFLLAPERIGLLGLFLAAIAFCAILVGWDFYTHTVRVLVASPEDRWLYIVGHHFLAIGLQYLVLLPAIYLFLFYTNLLPRQLAVWFYAILVVEHLSQECGRILIGLRKPILASSILVIRMGVWVWLLFPVIWYYPQLRHLETVWFAWLIGSGVSLGVGLSIIIGHLPQWGRWKVDAKWVGVGIRTGTLFLVATLSIKLILTADKFVMDILNSRDLVAAYALYSGAAMALVNFLDAGVFQFAYPKVVSAFRRNETVLFVKELSTLRRTAVSLALFLGLSVIGVAPFVFSSLADKVYIENIHVLWILITGSALFGISLIYHYALYAAGHDKFIVFIHLIAVAIFGSAILMLGRGLPVETPAIAVLAACTFILAGKYFIFRKLMGSVVNRSRAEI